MTPEQINAVLRMAMEDDTGAGFGVWLLMRSGVVIRAGAVSGFVQAETVQGSLPFDTGGTTALLLIEDDESDCTTGVAPGEVAAMAIDWAPIAGSRAYGPGKAPCGPFSHRDPGPVPPLTAV